MRAQGSNKQIKQIGRARTKQSGTAGKNDWKEELRARNLARREQKEKEEKMNKLAVKKQALKNAKKENKLDAELAEAMKEKKDKKQAKQEQTTIIRNGEEIVKPEKPTRPLEEILKSASKKTFIVTRDEGIVESLAAFQVPAYLLNGNGIKINLPDVQVVKSIQELATREGEIITGHRAGKKKAKTDGFVQIVTKNGEWFNPHKRQKSGSYLAFERLHKGGQLSEIIAKTELAFQKAKCMSNPEGRVHIMIRVVERQFKENGFDYTKFKVIREEEKKEKK